MPFGISSSPSEHPMAIGAKVTGRACRRPRGKISEESFRLRQLAR